MYCGSTVSTMDFLEKEPIEAEPAARELARARQQEYRPTAARLQLAGTILCILAPVMLFLLGVLAIFSHYRVDMDLAGSVGVSLLLLLVAAGAACFVLANTQTEAFDKLLEQGDYTRPQKACRPLLRALISGYWLAATAIYLIYVFGPWGNGQPDSGWLLWAVAGVLFAAGLPIAKHYFIINKKKSA